MGGGGKFGSGFVGSLASNDIYSNAFSDHQSFSDYVNHRLLDHLARLPINPDILATTTRLQQLIDSFTPDELSTLEKIETKLLTTQAAANVPLDTAPFTLSMTLATAAALPDFPFPSASLIPALTPTEFHALNQIIDQRSYSASSGQWQRRQPNQADLRTAPDPQNTQHRRRRRRPSSTNKPIA